MADRTRLSDKAAKAAEPPASGQALTWDTEIRGLGLRVTAKGARSFVFDYRAEGVKRRYTIGRYPDWSVQAARAEAKALRKRVDRGEDPMAERREDREAATVKRLWELYERDHAPTKRHAPRDRQLWERHVKSELGNRKVAAVRRADIRELHRKVTAAGWPIAANRVVALLSKMFSMAVADYEMRPDNPAKGIPRNPENKRERFLSQVEIARLSDALTRYPSAVAANAIRMLLLTGARKGEVMHMRWDQVDMDRGIWTKPSAHTKQKKDHRVPLSAPARQLLQDIAQQQEGNPSEWVFPGRRVGEPIRSLKTAWEWLRAEAGIEDVRIHDLRHTYASILVSAGMSLPMIGHLLGHTQPQTTQRYAHLYDDPLREATERVGAVVTGAGQGGQVVPMQKRGQG